MLRALARRRIYATPDKVFTPEERAIWRNLMSCALDDPAEVLKRLDFGLPGFWPNDYDFAKEGWIGNLNARDAQDALDMIVDGDDDEFPERFFELRSTNDELVLEPANTHS